MELMISSRDTDVQNKSRELEACTRQLEYCRKQLDETVAKLEAERISSGTQLSELDSLLQAKTVVAAELQEVRIALRQRQESEHLKLQREKEAGCLREKLRHNSLYNSLYTFVYNPSLLSLNVVASFFFAIQSLSKDASFQALCANCALQQ